MTVENVVVFLCVWLVWLGFEGEGSVFMCVFVWLWSTHTHTHTHTNTMLILCSYLICLLFGFLVTGGDSSIVGTVGKRESSRHHPSHAEHISQVALVQLCYSRRNRNQQGVFLIRFASYFICEQGTMSEWDRVMLTGTGLGRCIDMQDPKSSKRLDKDKKFDKIKKQKQKELDKTLDKVSHFAIVVCVFCICEIVFIEE
jgi:hypothetical protein